MRTLGTALILVVLLGASAWAQSDEDRQNCSNPDKNPDLAIPSCSVLIQSGTVSGQDLSILLSDRSRAFDDKGDYDHAIQDSDEAIRLSPTSVAAFNNRGIAYIGKRDFDRAIQDYDEAIRLSPTSAIAFYGRGNAYYSKGDYDHAIRDYDEAIRLNPTDAANFKTFNMRGNQRKSLCDCDEPISGQVQAIGEPALRLRSCTERTPPQMARRQKRRKVQSELLRPLST